ncbi:MAG: cupin domain-containing protein [Verrucomicrobiales bacterium]|nr:cupin domain-containing protein [Verrucomicrobiales bacterium]
MQNFFANLPDVKGAEVVEPLTNFVDHGKPTVRLQRIVSGGHASPVGFWYEQDEDEWVMLLRGEACLLLAKGEAEEEQTVEMHAGDYLELPAGLRHRVECVSGDAIWLALHGAIEQV